MREGTSAVIAAFNHETYIAEAVLSLADQVDEVIVVDDCSADLTVDVVRSLGVANLVVLENRTRRGVSLSFNRAVDSARHETVLIQGGDDRSLPGRAAYQVEALRDPAVIMTCSLPLVINETGQRLPEDVAGEFQHRPEDEDDLTHLFLRGNFVCAPSVAIRRSDYLRHGGFQNGIDLLQDYLLWLRLTAEGRLDVSQTPVVEYRKHSSNLSREYVGLDGARQRRLDAELAYCRASFLENSSRATRERLANSLGLPREPFIDLADDEQVALIELSHPDKIMVRRALDFVFAAAGSANHEERLSRLGLEPADLGRLANIADIENRGDVERATRIRTTTNSR